MAKKPLVLLPGTFHRISYRGEDREVFVLNRWEGKVHVLSTGSLREGERLYLIDHIYEAGDDPQAFYRFMPEDLKPYYRTLLPEHIAAPVGE